MARAHRARSHLPHRHTGDCFAPCGRSQGPNGYLLLIRYSVFLFWKHNLGLNVWADHPAP